MTSSFLVDQKSHACSSNLKSHLFCRQFRAATANMGLLPEAHGIFKQNLVAKEATFLKEKNSSIKMRMGLKLPQGMYLCCCVCM